MSVESQYNSKIVGLTFSGVNDYYTFSRAQNRNIHFDPLSLAVCIHRDSLRNREQAMSVQDLGAWGEFLVRVSKTDLTPRFGHHVPM